MEKRKTPEIGDKVIVEGKLCNVKASVPGVGFMLHEMNNKVILMTETHINWYFEPISLENK